MNKDIYILAIETSCDETSISIVKNGNEDIATVVLSQIDIHTEYGGVVPEIASRMHCENITIALERLLLNANFKIENIDAIAVTYAPGLLGSLLVGLEFAKTLCLVYNKPLIKVHHIASHIYANNLVNKIKFPILALVVSGGHTELILMNNDYDFQILGKTLDDAIGEVFDKVARVLDLPYPGGPNVEKYALNGKDTYELPKLMNNETLDFSYSGLKSAVINLIHKENVKGNPINKYDLSYSFQSSAVEQLERKTDQALTKYRVNQLIVAGGVSANQYLKEQLAIIANKHKIDFLVPPLKYCTDNATMVGAAAYPLFLKKDFAKFDLNALSKADLN